MGAKESAFLLCVAVVLSFCLSRKEPLKEDLVERASSTPTPSSSSSPTAHTPIVQKPVANITGSYASLSASTNALQPDQFFETLVLPKEESKPPQKTQPFFAQLEDDGTGPYAPGNVQSIATASEPINFINGGATSAIEDANISVSNFAATKMSPQEEVPLPEPAPKSVPPQERSTAIKGHARAHVIGADCTGGAFCETWGGATGFNYDSATPKERSTFEKIIRTSSRVGDTVKIVFSTQGQLPQIQAERRNVCFLWGQIDSRVVAGKCESDPDYVSQFITTHNHGFFSSLQSLLKDSAHARSARTQFSNVHVDDSGPEKSPQVTEGEGTGVPYMVVLDHANTTQRQNTRVRLLTALSSQCEGDIHDLPANHAAVDNVLTNWIT
jgi:hypothetical protein